MPQTKQEKLAALQEQAGPDGVIPESAIPDGPPQRGTPLSPGQRSRMRSSWGVKASASAAEVDRLHQQALRQHWWSLDPEGEFEAKQRQRREEELAERHAQWAATQAEAA